MHTKRHIYLFLIAVLISVLPLNATTPEPAYAATILRVIETGLSSGSCGGDWTTNACDLQNALSQAASGDEIWVAAGTYKPTTSADRTVTFQLKTGVAVYGGFAGDETLRSERDWATNVTVLSGDIGTVDDIADNSYHVVTGSGTDATAVLDGFTITAGNANGSDPHNAGGGMHNSSGSPTVTNITFNGNSAQHGGGIFNDNSSSPSVANATFSNNSAAVGGGMHNDNSSNPTVTDVTFSSNSATYGGGMKNDRSSHPTLTNVTFTGNSASFGGGMHNTGTSSPTLTNVTFGNNSASLGGGMFNYDSSNSVLGDVTFSNNSATVYGGGVYNNASSPALTNVIFSGNSASSGGGMSNRNFSSPTLTKVTFSGNSAQEGGGMGNYDSSSPLLMEVTFLGNSATVYGGGMYNDASSPALTNVIFSGNSAEEGGGIRNVGGCNPTLTNVTFSGNSATTYGGGIFNYDGNPTLTNSILWGNTAGAAGAQIYTNDAPLITASYSDIQGGWTGTGNIDADPLFVDADGADNVPGTADDNLRLQSGSPAIDAGSNATVPAGVTTDLDGALRIWNGAVDMGAYERHPWFVNDDGAAGAGCVSWADACPDLQTALGLAVSGDEIWVAAGTYTPTRESAPGDPRSATFQLKNGVALYGGFDPTVGDTDWEDRDWVSNVTVLSGDIGVAGDPADNSYHVFYHPSELALDSSAVLDGFTVTDGNANGSDNHAQGGGMYNDYSSPAVTNCTFSGNSAYIHGGGMSNWNSSPVVINSTFLGNSAGYGGGMYNYYSSPAVTNCSFRGNSAALHAMYGGGMTNVDSSPVVTNCIFWGNSGAAGGGMFNNGGSPAVINSILWGNSPDELNDYYSQPVVSYSDIQGGYSGAGNIDADPLFVDADGADNIPGTADDNLRLQPGSPAIDAGSNAALPADASDLDGDGDTAEPIPFDLDGYTRTVNGTVDMGAYEHQAEPPVITALQISNLSDTSATLSWLTDRPADSQVHFGASTSLGQIAYDDRGATTTSRTHHVTLSGLTPSTAYFFYVASDDSVDDNGGALYQFSTGPTVALSSPDLIYGQVFLPDGVTPAAGALVYVTLRDGNGQGSPGDAALLSYVVRSSDGGYWNANLGNARTPSLAQPFQYSMAGDQVRLTATDGSGCVAEQVVDTNGDTPAPNMTLTCPIQVTHNLAFGWNLMGLNVLSDPVTSAEEALDDIEAQGGNASEINRWLNGGWDTHIHNLPFNEFSLQLGEGYFVKTPLASTWQRSGWPPSNPVPVTLTPGWNLVSFPKLTCPLSAEQVLDGIQAQGGASSEIDQWLNGGWMGHIHNLPFNDFPIAPDQGYFVRCTAASVYVPCQSMAERAAAPTAEPVPTPALQAASDPLIGDVWVTNRRDVALTVAWRTDQASDGWVEYGLTPELGQTAYEERGRDAVATLHQATLAGLTPETTYYLRVRSGKSAGDDGKPIQVTTAPTTPPAMPFLSYGQVLNGDGSPAGGALVVVRLGADHVQRSEPYSALVDGAGYWALSLPVDACQMASLSLEVIRPDGSRESFSLPACAAQPAPAVQFKD